MTPASAGRATAHRLLGAVHVESAHALAEGAAADQIQPGT